MKPKPRISNLKSQIKRHSMSHMPLHAQLCLLLLAWPAYSHAPWVDPRSLNSPIAHKDKTVIEMSIAELQRYCPSGLQPIEFRQTRTAPASLLKMIGERVQTFFRNFSDTSSTEKVLLQKLGPGGFVLSSMSQEFNYLTLYRPTGKKPFLEEFRTDRKYRPIEQKATGDYVMTAGYLGGILHFHPQFQSLSDFRYLGKQASGVHLIAFAHKNEANDLLVGFTDVNIGQAARFPVQGIAWIDPGTYQILRMYTSLRNTGQSSRLKEQITDISFTQMHFINSPEQFWMPSAIIVSTTITNVVFHNRHRYSDYKLFTVNSEIKLEKPKAEKQITCADWIWTGIAFQPGEPPHRPFQSACARIRLGCIRKECPILRGKLLAGRSTCEGQAGTRRQSRI